MDEADAAAAEAQSGKNESDSDLDLWPPASQVGKHSGVSAECVSREIEDRTCVCCFDNVECVEKVRSAVKDCSQMYSCRGRLVTARISIQLCVLDNTKRILGHDQAPSKRLTQPQVSGNILFSPACAPLPH